MKKTQARSRPDVSKTLTADVIRSVWGYEPEPGMLYVTSRAISSRVNSNYDAWSPEELKQTYATFVGRPIYVEHHNWDPKRTRGVIVGARLHENKLASGAPDVWVELLEEIDAVTFPRLARLIMSGENNGVSMGADLKYTTCSVCDNKSYDLLDICSHIANKGSTYKLGSKEVLAYERCHGSVFFEISHVENPADESADVLGYYLCPAGRGASSNRRVTPLRGSHESHGAYLQRVAKKKNAGMEVLVRQPQDVNTLRDDTDEPLEIGGDLSESQQMDLETLDQFQEYLDDVREDLQEELLLKQLEEQQAQQLGFPQELQVTSKRGTMNTKQAQERASRIAQRKLRRAEGDAAFTEGPLLDEQPKVEDVSEDSEFIAPDATTDVEALDSNPVTVTVQDGAVTVEASKEKAQRALAQVKKAGEGIECEGMRVVEDDDSDEESESDSTSSEEDSSSEESAEATSEETPAEAPVVEEAAPIAPEVIQYAEEVYDVDLAAPESPEEEVFAEVLELVQPDSPADIDAVADVVGLLDDEIIPEGGLEGPAVVAAARKFMVRRAARLALAAKQASDAPKEDVEGGDPWDDTASAVDTPNEDDDASNPGSGQEGSPQTIASRTKEANELGDVEQTDVENLDDTTETEAEAAEPTVERVDVETDSSHIEEQLDRADRADDYNDGMETASPEGEAAFPVTNIASKINEARAKMLLAMEVQELQERLGMPQKSRTAAVAELEKQSMETLQGYKKALLDTMVTARRRQITNQPVTASRGLPRLARSTQSAPKSVVAGSDDDDLLLTLG